MEGSLRWGGATATRAFGEEFEGKKKGCSKGFREEFEGLSTRSKMNLHQGEKADAGKGVGLFFIAGRYLGSTQIASVVTTFTNVGTTTKKKMLARLLLVSMLQAAWCELI
jgi:hypothetical protein